VSAQAAPNCLVYWCIVCGPCLRELFDTPQGQRSVTVHLNIKHPDDMT